MLECKCLKNLTGFFIAKPPFVIFVLCLGTFAVGLVSLGLYVITHDFLETDPSKDWYSFFAALSQVSVCVPSVLTNRSSDHKNYSSSPDYHDYFKSSLVNVSIPITVSFKPTAELSHHNNTQVTTYLRATDLGIKDKHERWHKINLTITLDYHWQYDSCTTRETCETVFWDACVTLIAPASILPPLSRLPEKCMNSSLPKKMSNLKGWISQDQAQHMEDWCRDGVVMSTEPPQPSLLSQSPLSPDEQAKANLHLQYSSYILFVMVITCVVYAMIRGKPAKFSPKKMNPLI